MRIAKWSAFHQLGFVIVYVLFEIFVAQQCLIHLAFRQSSLFNFLLSCSIITMDSYLYQRQFWRLCGLLLLKCAMKNKIKNVKFRAVLRLVFTSDGVVVGVAIRRVERYDLVKIKPTESKQNTDSAYVSVAYDQVKTALSESQAEAEE